MTVFSAKIGHQFPDEQKRCRSFIISLLIPDNEAGTTHLKILASIARMLMTADIKESLLLATSEQEIETILNNYLKQ